MSSSIPILHRQPFKGIYIVGFTLQLLLVKVPTWLVTFALKRSARPVASWPIRRSILLRIIRDFSQLSLKVNLGGGRDLSVEVKAHELKNARFVWVEPVDESLIRGEVKRIAEINNVKPARIPGYWLGQGLEKLDVIPQAEEGEKTILHFHGGGFTVRIHPIFIKGFTTAHLFIICQVGLRSPFGSYCHNHSRPVQTLSHPNPGLLPRLSPVLYDSSQSIPRTHLRCHFSVLLSYPHRGLLLQKHNNRGRLGRREPCSLIRPIFGRPILVS